MNKLLIVCGPTGVGKTNMGLYLAKTYNGELISADSRQVYKGMDIGTGKDLPLNAKYKSLNNKYGFYEINGVRLWGYDLVQPKENFSISQYLQFVRLIFENIWERRKLPILVGGTGFYIKGLIDGVGTLDVPQDLDLRRSLETKSAEELFEILATSDPIKSASMNISDRKNPRRLIRAIEISKSNEKPTEKSKKENYDILMIGLTAPLPELVKRVRARVDQRLIMGTEQEIQKLLDSGIVWNSQSMQALGYRQWMDYFNGSASLDETANNWKSAEIKYLKRQITWFKKDKRINWFNVLNAEFKEDVEKLLKKWQNE